MLPLAELMDSRQPTRRTDPESMAEPELCGRCRFSATCVYGTAEQELIIACPGFQPESFTVKQSNGAVNTGAIGLCTSCERLEKCTRERPQSGVWHCEDYC